MEDQQLSMLSLEADTEELTNFNPEADANQLLPAVPAGRYFVKFFFQNANELEEKDGIMQSKRFPVKIWGKKMPQKVVQAPLTMEIYNSEGGEYDGRQVRDSLVSSMLRPNGTCSLQGVVQCITGGYPPAVRSRQQMAALLQELIGEDGGATGEVEVDWEASETLTDEERDKLEIAGKRQFRLRGMKNFPPVLDENNKPVPGKYISEILHNGIPCRAFNIVSRYITAQAPGDGASAPVEAAPAAPPPQAPRMARPVAAQPPTQQAPPQAPRAPQSAPAPSAPQAGPPVPPATQQRRVAPPAAPRRA